MDSILFSILMIWFSSVLVLRFIRPIEIENSRIAKIIGYNIVLYPFVLYIEKPSAIEVSHEFIHISQIKRVGLIWFYLTYVWYYLQNRFKGMSHLSAYLENPYEIEANKYESTIKKHSI